MSRKQKTNIPRSVLDGLAKTFECAKQSNYTDKFAVYAVAQRVLRLVSMVAIKRANNELACSICSETVKAIKGDAYYLDHTEDCPLSWVDQIKL